MPIARHPTTVLDCPDPAALASFYGAMLDWTVQEHDDWFEIRADHGDSIAFQQVADYRPPDWPGQESPQQMHLAFVVAPSTTTSPERRSGSSSTRPATPSACASTDASRDAPRPPPPLGDGGREV